MRSTQSSEIAWFSSAKFSLATEPSGPGVPALRIWPARMFVSRLTSASTHSFISRSRWTGSVRPVRFQTSTATAMAPLPRLARPPPIDTRSFISVVIETRQPSPSPPRRRSSGRRTSLRYTSWNSASPVICRSGRTSTPSACMSQMKYVRPGCFGTSGSVRVTRKPAGDVGQRRPDLLPVDDPLVAVPDGPGGEPGQVGAGTGLGEQLAPDLLPGEQGPEEPGALLGGAVDGDGRGGHAHADDVAGGVGGGSPGLGQGLVDDALQPRGEPEPAGALGEVDP